MVKIEENSKCSIINLTHSLDPKTGGVLEAVRLIEDEIISRSFKSELSANQKKEYPSRSIFIAHGLWQWPGVIAYKNWRTKNIPYLVFPHGMMDPWFKRNYPLKHVKKQLYWWWRQGKILRNAHAVCFTTEEERQLAKKTFWPYQCREVVTGLGVADPPGDEHNQKNIFKESFPQTKNKKVLLYMGRIHPKKGLGLLLNAFIRQKRKDDLLVIAAPIPEKNPYYQKLRKQAQAIQKQVIWTGMLEGDLKWGALRSADSLILPSHQENYGMVVAEACSVGTPVLLSNKVNLYHEILEDDAGLVEKDTQEGIDNLLGHWLSGRVQSKSENARRCFQENLHISKTTDRLIELIREAAHPNSI